MTPEQITSVADKDLCFAFDRLDDGESTIRDEVARRQLNCGQVLLGAGLEPKGGAVASLKSIPAEGDCAGVEFMGVFATEAVVGIRGQSAKIRNTAAYAKLVTVSFFHNGESLTARGQVKAGEIQDLRLVVSDRPVSNTRITECR